MSLQLDGANNALKDPAIGSELMKFGLTAAAVNEVKVSNAATAGKPLIEATGDDTDIGLEIKAKGTGDVLISSDINANGGHRQMIDGWFQDNVAASQTAVALARNAAPAFGDKLVMPRAGSITGVCVKSNAARTNGTLTVEVYKGGAATGLTAVIDGTNTTFKATTQAKDADTFNAGDELDIRITTTGTWTPTTADIRASLEVET